MKKYLADNGGVFVAPLDDDPSEILQFNNDSHKIEYVECEELFGMESKLKNHKCLVGM